MQWLSLFFFVLSAWKAVIEQFHDEPLLAKSQAQCGHKALHHCVICTLPCLWWFNTSRQAAISVQWCFTGHGYQVGFKSVLTSHTHTPGETDSRSEGFDWFILNRGDSKKKKCCVRLGEPSVSTAEVSRSLRAEPGYSVSRLGVGVKGDARCTSRWAVTQCLTELLSTPVRGKAKNIFSAEKRIGVVLLFFRWHKNVTEIRSSSSPAQQARCDVVGSQGLIGVLSSRSDFLLSSQSNWSWWFINNKTRIQILTLTDWSFSLLLKKILHLWLLR